MDDLKIIGRNIARIRTQKKLSQEDLCGIADIDRSYLSEIENGHKNFSVRVFLKIARSLDIPPENLLQFKK
ncbi:MAG: helix-turn-helix transcriptional regulator [Alphaproteobacteria bacterium]|nr:helix-turn-helix transcriptional regulator [Alphaproteobacteria bacterium]